MSFNLTDDPIHNAKVLTCTLVPVFSIVQAIKLRKDFPKTDSGLKKFVWNVIVTNFWMSGILWSVAALTYVPFIARKLGLRTTQFLIALVVIIVGFLAHSFKKRSQYLYGLVEVAFGASSALAVAVVMPLTTIVFSRWAALLGCAYIVARGANNLSDAISKAEALRKASEPIDLP